MHRACQFFLLLSQSLPSLAQESSFRSCWNIEVISGHFLEATQYLKKKKAHWASLEKTKTSRKKNIQIFDIFYYSFVLVGFWRYSVRINYLYLYILYMLFLISFCGIIFTIILSIKIRFKYLPKLHYIKPKLSRKKLLLDKSVLWDVSLY